MSGAKGLPEALEIPAPKKNAARLINFRSRGERVVEALDKRRELIAKNFARTSEATNLCENRLGLQVRGIEAEILYEVPGDEVEPLRLLRTECVKSANLCDHRRTRSSAVSSGSAFAACLTIEMRSASAFRWTCS